MGTIKTTIEWHDGRVLPVIRKDIHGMDRNVFLVVTSGWMCRIDGVSRAKPAYCVKSRSGGYEWVDYRNPVLADGSRNVLADISAWAEMPVLEMDPDGKIKQSADVAAIIS